MPRRAALAVLLGAALALAGCGGDDDEGAPLPAAQVQLLERRLTETENRLGDGSVGACQDILEDTRPEVNRVLDSLPDEVDADVRSALADSFDRLWALVEDECSQREPEEEPAPEPEPEPEPVPTVTETVPAEPDDDDDEEPPRQTNPEEAPLPPDGDGNSGGAVPPAANGQGNGGGFGPGGQQGGSG